MVRKLAIVTNQEEEAEAQRINLLRRNIKAKMRAYERRLETLFAKPKRNFARRKRKLNLINQRAKYAAGAAQSATPPPEKCPDRDKKASEIIGFIEENACDHEGRILVTRLVESFLYEQRRIKDEDVSSFIQTTNRELIKQIAYSDQKGQRSILRRFKLRGDKHIQKLRIYGWKYHTDVFKAPFFAWSMERHTTRTFTVNFTKDVLDAAKNSKKSTISHLLDRFRRLCKTRFGDGIIECWFGLEKGTKGGLHAHGAVSWPDNTDEQKELIEALRVWSGGDAPNQIYIAKNTLQGTWANYAKKCTFSTEAIVQGPTFTATSELRKRAKALFEEFHSEYRRIAREKATR